MGGLQYFIQVWSTVSFKSRCPPGGSESQLRRWRYLDRLARGWFILFVGGNSWNLLQCL